MGTISTAGQQRMSRSLVRGTTGTIEWLLILFLLSGQRVPEAG